MSRHFSPVSLLAQSRLAAWPARSQNSGATHKSFIKKEITVILRLTLPFQTSQNENAQTPLQEGPGTTHDGGTIKGAFRSAPNDTPPSTLCSKEDSMKIQLYTLHDLAQSSGGKIDKVRRNRDKLPAPNLVAPGGQGTFLWTAERLKSGGIEVPARASVQLDLS